MIQGGKGGQKQTLGHRLTSINIYLTHKNYIFLNINMNKNRQEYYSRANNLKLSVKIIQVGHKNMLKIVYLSQRHDQNIQFSLLFCHFHGIFFGLWRSSGWTAGVPQVSINSAAQSAPSEYADAVSTSRANGLWSSSKLEYSVLNSTIFVLQRH